MKPALRDHCHERPPVLKDHIFISEGSTCRYKWSCHHRLPVLSDHIFMANRVVFQDRFYSTSYIPVLKNSLFWPGTEMAVWRHDNTATACRRSFHTLWLWTRWGDSSHPSHSGTAAACWTWCALKTCIRATCTCNLISRYWLYWSLINSHEY